MKTNARMRKLLVLCFISCYSSIYAQIPDLVSTFEMGGKAIGMGGGIYSNLGDPTSSYWNPAGLSSIQTPVFQMDFRNRPLTESTFEGSLENFESSGQVNFGHQAVGFIGVAFPFGSQGTVALSYALGGYAREKGFGTQMTSSSFPGIELDVTTDFKHASEFFTLAYSKRMSDTMSVGIGLIGARENISDFRIIETTESKELLESGGFTDSGFGFGGIVGIIFTPPQNPNVSFGASFRSEISLNNLNEGALYIKKIPARVQGGLAYRVDGFRGGQDYLVGGVDVMYILPANKGLELENKGQFSAGLGVEYNWNQSFGIVPFRIGFRTVNRATNSEFGNRTDAFRARQSFSLGVGIRPKTGDYSADLAIITGSGQKSPDICLTFQVALK
jgi:hypothetical protein